MVRQAAAPPPQPPPPRLGRRRALPVALFQELELRLARLGLQRRRPLGVDLEDVPREDAVLVDVVLVARTASTASCACRNEGSGEECSMCAAEGVQRAGGGRAPFEEQFYHLLTLVELLA